ncbi:MAG TPA: RDD family protein [Myxococcales bacterium]|nr:RDD family protein [Myxococcales bacterium]
MDPADPSGQRPSLPPADFRRRALARGIDLLIALAPLWLVPRGHPLAAASLSAALLVSGDALFGAGRSLGKRIAGLRVVVLATRRPAGLRESILRNGLFVVGIAPALAGAPPQISAAALACVVVLESGVALRPLTRDLGQRRLGDLVAGTQVIDGRVALGLPGHRVSNGARATAPLASRAARQEEETACASP